MVSKQEALRKRVVIFYNLNVSKGKKYTVDHFTKENVPVSTIYRILTSLAVDRKSGSGRPAKIMTKKKLAILHNTFNNNDAMSQRDAARKFKCSQPYICRSLKNIGLECRKKKRAPEYTDQQKSTIMSQCRWMTRSYKGKSFILDDESYFPLSKTHIPGNDRYYTSNSSTTPDNIKHKYKHKFEQKVMLYVAISDRGISKLWFKPSGLAVNQKVYESECLKKILIPLFANITRMENMSFGRIKHHRITQKKHYNSWTLIIYHLYQKFVIPQIFHNVGRSKIFSVI